MDLFGLAIAGCCLNLLLKIVVMHKIRSIYSAVILSTVTQAFAVLVQASSGRATSETSATRLKVALVIVAAIVTTTGRD